MSTESLITIASFVLTTFAMVWRFSSMATKFEMAIKHLEEQSKNVAEVPLMAQRLTNLEKSVSGFPQALQEIKVLQYQVGSIRSMRAVRVPSRPDYGNEDDEETGIK